MATALSLTIAFVGAVISWLQWYLAENKLKLELFDRRYAIYRAISRHIAEILREGRAVTK